METDHSEKLKNVFNNLSRALEVAQASDNLGEPLFGIYLKLKDQGCWEGKYNLGSLIFLREIARHERKNHFGGINGKN